MNSPIPTPNRAMLDRKHSTNTAAGPRGARWNTAELTHTAARAVRKLAAGPARAVSAIPCLGCLK